MLQQIVFIVISILALGFAGKQFMKIRKNVFLGLKKPLTGSKSERWKNVIFIALGQKKMFKRFIPAIFHLFIYIAFLFTQIELLEIFVDGIFGVHRFFAPYLGSFYLFIIGLIEFLSFGALIATFVFLSRRNLLKLPRFHKSEMKGWPKLDGNIILYLELLLVIGIFSMNGADMVLQDMHAHHYTQTGDFLISGWLGPSLFGGFSEGTLIGIERFGWWLHILVVFGFLNYLPISKHLHLLLAFPNTFYAPLKPAGEMDNMDVIMNEVKSMMNPDAAMDEGSMDEELPTFGANDIFSLNFQDVLSAYTCTECGRCTSVCPANITGKKLSPRKIMMDIRDRADEIGKNIEANNLECIAADKREGATKLTADNYDDGKSLFDYISREEIHACTTCMACVEACPILIRPVDQILKLRRYEILTESAGPAEWLPMYNAIEQVGAVWQMSESRDAWTTD